LIPSTDLTGLGTTTMKNQSKIFFNLLARWIGTVIFTALIIATVVSYRAKDDFPSDQKTAFNAIMTVLILLWASTSSSVIKTPTEIQMKKYN
jgi:hypothetical protein